MLGLCWEGRGRSQAFWRLASSLLSWGGSPQCAPAFINFSLRVSLWQLEAGRAFLQSNIFRFVCLFFFSSFLLGQILDAVTQQPRQAWIPKHSASSTSLVHRQSKQTVEAIPQTGIHIATNQGQILDLCAPVSAVWWRQKLHRPPRFKTV